MIELKTDEEEYDEHGIDQCICDARSFAQCGNYDLAISALYNVLNRKSTPKQRITACKILSLCYRKTEQYSLALLHINKAISINSAEQPSEEAKEEKAICLMNKGVVYEELGRMSDAIACYQPAVHTILELFEKRQDSHGIIINALITLGTCYEKIGKNNMAYEIYKECLKYFHEGAENDRRYHALIHAINKYETG